MNSSISVIEPEILPAAVKTHRRFDKRLLVLPLVAIAALALRKPVSNWWTIGRFTETTDDAYVGGDVTVIAPRVTGLVEHVFVTDNQFVHAGDPLLKLDDRDYKAALAKATAGIAAQEAALGNLDAMQNLQGSIIAQAEAGIDAAQAEVTRTRDEWNRYKQLSDQSAESVQSYQRAEAEYKGAVALDAKAHAFLETARRQILVIATQKQQAAAAKAQAVADRDLAALTLDYTEIRSPIDGFVGNRSVRAGIMASVGAQLMSIVPAQGLWIDANFKETQLKNLHAGQPVAIHADSSPDKIFHGHISSLSPATGAQFSVLPPENATGNFTKIVQRIPVRIALDGEAGILGELRPGLSVTAKVDERTDVNLTKS